MELILARGRVEKDVHSPGYAQLAKKEKQEKQSRAKTNRGKAARHQPWNFVHFQLLNFQSISYPLPRLQGF